LAGRPHGGVLSRRLGHLGVRAADGALAGRPEQRRGPPPRRRSRPLAALPAVGAGLGGGVLRRRRAGPRPGLPCRRRQRTGDPAHGGPMMSFSTWSWRWCPHMLAARGYAVLLPNPALSSGFGQDFVRRGWGRWGEATTVDVTAALDAALQRPDIDASRTAAMGGSF